MINLSSTSKKDWANNETLESLISMELQSVLKRTNPFDCLVNDISKPLLMSVWLVAGPEPNSESPDATVDELYNKFECLYSYGHCFIAQKNEFANLLVPGLNSDLSLYERILLHSNRGVRIYADIVLPMNLHLNMASSVSSKHSKSKSSSLHKQPQTKYIPMTLELLLKLEVDERAADVSSESFTSALFGGDDSQSDSKRFSKNRARVSTGKVGSVGSDPVAMRRAIQASIKQSYDQFADYSSHFHSQGDAPANLGDNNAGGKKSAEGRIFPKGRGLLQLATPSTEFGGWRIVNMMGEGRQVTHPLVSSVSRSNQDVKVGSLGEVLCGWRSDPLFI